MWLIGYILRLVPKLQHAENKQQEASYQFGANQNLMCSFQVTKLHHFNHFQRRTISSHFQQGNYRIKNDRIKELLTQ